LLTGDPAIRLFDQESQVRDVSLGDDGPHELAVDDDWSRKEQSGDMRGLADRILLSAQSVLVHPEIFTLGEVGAYGCIRRVPVAGSDGVACCIDNMNQVDMEIGTGNGQGMIKIFQYRICRPARPFRLNGQPGGHIAWPEQGQRRVDANRVDKKSGNTAQIIQVSSDAVGQVLGTVMSQLCFLPDLFIDVGVVITT
jgi:hypothetical protein